MFCPKRKEKKNGKWFGISDKTSPKKTKYNMFNCRPLPKISSKMTNWYLPNVQNLGGQFKLHAFN